MTSWRVGRKLGRTLYRDEVCVGMVDTPLIAAEIVEAMNGKDGPTGYRLGEGRTMKDVLDTEAELLESEGLEPEWVNEGEGSEGRNLVEEAIFNYMTEQDFQKLRADEIAEVAIKALQKVTDD